MSRSRACLALACLGLLLGRADRPAEAVETGKYLFDPGGRVLDARVLDVDGNGRPDLVALVQSARSADQTLLVLRTPDTPVKRSYYPADHVTRIPCGGALSDAGSVSVGRFGPKGEARLRFLTPRGVLDVRPDGSRVAQDERRSRPTLFGRSPGRSIVFWDGVADLDGDGIDEIWYPLAEGDGPLHVLAGRARDDQVLALDALNRSSSSVLNLVSRTADVPSLFPADLEGDGRYELVALRDKELIAWTLGGTGAGGGGGPVAPAFRLKLPFLEADPSLGPEDQRTPRIQLADVNGDGRADLLVTLVTGKRSRVESLRTILFHYPGPFRDPKTGTLVPPRARLDTQSVVLHPTFVDMDRDGDLEYVGDSIRGSRLDLIARVLGKDPDITYVGFRFDQKTGTFESAPYFTTKRAYPSSEALSNRFGRNARFDGDFDGDGHTDLIDLGDLAGVEVIRGVPRSGRGDPLDFKGELVARVPVKEGLAADGLIADLNNDGRADAVLWSRKSMFFIVSTGGR